MGTPDFAVPALQKLIDLNFPIEAVYTQPPRPAGRGQKVQYSPVHQLALDHHVPVLTPLTLKEAQAREQFKSHNCDFALVAAYGLILPAEILKMPKGGCVNIHGSLLPRWRGAAPVQRAIWAGDTLSGITMMQMDAGLDTGDILLEKSVPILADTTARTLYYQLAQLGADQLEITLQGLQEGSLVRRRQSDEGITYAAKIRKDESILDWTQPAQQLERQVRALDLWPGASFLWQDQHIKVLQAAWESLPEKSFSPGEIIDDSLLIACGHDALRLLKLQKPGKAPCSAKDFLNGTPMKAGIQLPLFHAPL